MNGTAPLRERRLAQRRKSTGRRIADVPGRRIVRRRRADRQGPYRKENP